MVRVEEILFFVGVIALMYQLKLNRISKRKVDLPVDRVTKTIAVSPGINYFKIVYVQDFGTVDPPQLTGTGYPKNTIIELNEIAIEYHPKDGTCRIDVRDEQ